MLCSTEQVQALQRHGGTKATKERNILLGVFPFSFFTPSSIRPAKIPDHKPSAKHRKLHTTLKSLTAMSDNVGISRAESRKHIKLRLLHTWSDAAGKQREEDVIESWKGEGGMPRAVLLQ